MGAILNVRVVLILLFFVVFIGLIKQNEVVKREEEWLRECWNGLTGCSFRNVSEVNFQVSHPWNRMFEVGIELTVKFAASWNLR